MENTTTFGLCAPYHGKKMRTSRAHMTSGGIERVAGERAMTSVSFVNLRRHFSEAYRRNHFECRLFPVDSRIVQQLYDAMQLEDIWGRVWTLVASFYLLDFGLGKPASHISKAVDVGTY
jgi:hypothetical protein